MTDRGGDSGQNMEKSFERRMRTRVVGPEHRFAAIVPRELAPICLGEIRELGITGAETTEAGVEFIGKLTDAYRCNLQLRTASRVLCRFAPFRAGVAEELFYKVSEIPWELWINPRVPLEVEAHVEYSRISHEGKVAELVLQAVERSVPGVGGGARPEELKQKVLVHLTKNQCRISLDMSGAHLHERGYRIEHTGAPLRETLAAALLLKMEWNGGTPLVDGMCGSGTFPIEAAMIARRLPPGIGRDFLFEQWPSFRKKTWDYVCKSAREASKERFASPIFGIDATEESVRVSHENAVRAGVDKDIVFKSMDFFDFDPRDGKMKTGLLVLNPPYGKRLEGGGRSLYDRLGEHLRRKYKGWRYAVLCASRTDCSAMKMPLMRYWSFRHGGIPIYAALGKVA